MKSVLRGGLHRSCLSRRLKEVINCMGVFFFFGCFSISLLPWHFSIWGTLFVSVFLVTRHAFFLSFLSLMYVSVLLNSGPEVSGEALFFRKGLFAVDVFLL